jgi:hypothetical protein
LRNSLDSATRQTAGSWSSLRSSSVLDRYRTGPSRCPWFAASRAPRCTRCRPSWSWPPDRRFPAGRCSSQPSKPDHRTSPLLAVYSPLHRYTQCTSTPRSRSLHRSSDTNRQIPFRPRGFSPPRQLSPCIELRAYCVPLPAMGFDTFREARLRRSLETTAAQTTLPVSQAYTLRRFPLHQQPYRITAALAPLAVSCSTCAEAQVQSHRGEAPVRRSRLPRHPSRGSVSIRLSQA